MSISLKFDGGKDIERALADLPRGTAKGVTSRVLKKVLEPVRATAESYSVFDIGITSRLNPSQQSRAGADRGRSLVTQYVGPVDEHGVPHAHLIEFGTGPRHHESGKFVGAVAPDPFMRPAWEQHQSDLLPELGRLMWIEIEKTVARRAARAARG